MNNATGELYAKSKDQEFTIEFTICGIKSNNPNDCIKSESLSFKVFV